MADLWDPTKAECLGHYLYGTGFMLQHDLALRKRSGVVSLRPFCDRCARRNDCWDALRKRVDAEHPTEVAQFLHEVREAAKRGIPGGAVAARMAKEGNPDPYMKDATQNMKRGEIASAMH